MGGECDFGRGVWDQGEPGRVGDVSGVWEVVVAGVRTSRREKISTQRAQRSRGVHRGKDERQEWNGVPAKRNLEKVLG